MLCCHQNTNHKLGSECVILIISHICGILSLANNRDFLSQQLMWIGIYVAISLGISFIVPFPYSLPLIIGVVILLSFYVRRRMFRRMGMSGTSMFRGFGSSSLVNYYCMNCNTKHNQMACPKCGSKMKRIGS